MDSISLDQLDRLPFVDTVPSDGRAVVLKPYFDAQARDWHLYLEVERGHLGRIAGGEPVYGGYFSTELADPERDIELPFATVITQHLAFPKVHGRLEAIEEDIHQFAAILEKYSILSERHPSRVLASGRLIASELEYLFLVLRSLYDLLHSITSEICALFITLDGSRRRPTKSLPNSFASVVLDKDRLRTGDEVQSKYGLPTALANWYVTEAPTFREFRRLRDDIAHRGRTVPVVFELPEGLAFRISEQQFSPFKFWPENQQVRNQFGSARALFAALIGHGISLTDRLATALKASAQLPPSVGNGVRSYIRSPFGAQLVGIPEILANPWERNRRSDASAG